MMDLLFAVLTAGLAHFLIGGFWYSSLAFSRTWMHGLGLTQDDIAEAKVNIPLALLASAISSFAQAAALVWLFVVLGAPSLVLGGLIGGVLGLAFGMMPMLRDRVWADRPWSVILVDGSYEAVGGIAIGVIAAFWLGAA
jgi:Protein of unknown function (DUF1761)